MLGRRTFLFAGIAVVGGAGFYAADGRNLVYSALTETITGDSVDAPTAHRLASEGKIALIDIRRPDEWEKTGSDRGKPVALICARGVRSARMNNRLVEAGFTNIIDVPEGMLGSKAGPGWLKRSLPVVLNEQ